MRLETERDGSHEISTPQELEAALTTIEPQRNSFAILTAQTEVYLQTAADKEGFVVERRDGSAQSHAKAMRTALHPTWPQDRFDRAEMIAIFTTYLTGQQSPAGVRWEPLKMAYVSAMPKKFGRLLPIAIVAILLICALAIPLTLW
jgi:hypothetical protein